MRAALRRPLRLRLRDACSRPTGSRSTKTREFAALLFRFGEGGQERPAHAGRLRAPTSTTPSANAGARRAQPRSASASRIRGALDVKDVLGYGRLVLTAAAFDELAAAYAPKASPLMEARDVIIAPLITEKSMAATALQQYAFEVHPHATKTQIRQAVEEIFKVTVIKVNTVNVGGKVEELRAPRQSHVRQAADWKKAIVTLKPGQKIELGGVNYFEQ